MSVGEYSCNSPSTSEGSKSIFLVVCLHLPVCASDFPLKRLRLKYRNAAMF